MSRRETSIAEVDQAAAELDRSLLARFCAGDSGSFDRLLARHRLGVVNFLFRLTGDRGLAEDLGQETFVRVYLKADDFHGRRTPAGDGPDVRGATGTVRSWIYAIARNLAIDHSRVKFRLFGRRGRAVALCAAAEPAADGLPDIQAQRDEVRQLVGEAVQALSEPYRSAVVLVDIVRLPYEEAALAIGCSVKTLSSRVSRGRRQLATALDPELLESLE